MNNSIPLQRKKRWKLGLPMYLNTATTDKYYTALLQCLALELKRVGVQDDFEIITQFPKDLYAWWLNPDVLFTQSCGYPYITQLQDKVQLIGTPCFDLDGCESATYHSVFISHADQPWTSLAATKNARVVINQQDSNSGMNILRAEILKLITDNAPFFSSVQYSDSHMNSLKMIQQKQADIASIDCVTLAYTQQYAPELCKNIHLIGRSPQTSALPFIASAQVSIALKNTLILALKNVLHQQPELAQGLMIKDIIQTDSSDYLSILNLKHAAFNRPYFELSSL